MRVIPVLDLMNGIAVRAVEGNRTEYMPLKSVLCSSSDALDVAKAYEGFGFKELYIADLDGILKGQPNLDIIQGITDKTNLGVMADYGISRLEDLDLFGGFMPVVGTETLPSLDFLEKIGQRFALSIDTRNGVLMNNLGVTLDFFVDFFKNKKIGNVADIVVLDLSRAGTGKGPNVELCTKVIGKLGRAIYGCGVDSIGDIKKLVACGADGVLIGSALHNGNLNRHSLIGYL